MKDIELPPLPHGDIKYFITDSTMRRMECDAHSDRQLKSYARAAVEADRAQRVPDWETRAEIAEQQVVCLSEERDHFRDLYTKLLTSTPSQPAQQEPPPIDMVLHCPACGKQHIDASEPNDAELNRWLTNGWGNPPHRSHLCHGCSHIWRPADVPTNGVQAVKTKGKADSPEPPQPVERKPMMKEKCKTCDGAGGWEAAASSTSYFWQKCPDCGRHHGIRE